MLLTKKAESVHLRGKQLTQVSQNTSDYAKGAEGAKVKGQ